MNDLDALVDSARSGFEAATTPSELENAKARFLGKSGRLTEMMKGLSALGVEDKKIRGAAINQAKQAIEGALGARRMALADLELQSQLKAEALDVTLPGRRRGQGGLHPVSLTMERIELIFGSMGFEVAQGPEIEADWFNFTALNTPEDHPARSMHDTFYVEGGTPDAPNLLRTHTSPVQIRHALQHVKRHKAKTDAGQPMPEIRVIAPGRTYRVDSDATHSPMFHQCEGLWIGEQVSFKDLKVVFTDFCRTFFESEDLVLRFRPSFFPFTEPSAEIDIQFPSGPLAGRWLEVAGSGQVHPNVVRSHGAGP
jgi:phenylalanyl-tRNA synthetase alpha chain